MMITFALEVLNVVLWIWVIGIVFHFPFAVRYILRTRDTVKVEDALIVLLSSICWSVCIEDLAIEIDDIFGLEGDKTITAIFNKVLDYDLITTHRL